MESVLAVLCIVFFAILTYGLVQGRNLTKDHLYNCRTLYIPEYIDLELAYKNVSDLKNLDALKKRARELGASQKFVKRFDKDSNKTDLKKFIILNSISNEHILFDSIEDTLGAKETNKRELNNITTRVTNEVNNIPTPIPSNKKELYRDLGIDISGTDNEIKEQLIKKYLEQSVGVKGFNDPSISIKELRKDD
tara:strand:- start:1720 stop:2298 length:579 start_codon:yes stop_codon:yes gene_type:complete